MGQVDDALCLIGPPEPPAVVQNLDVGDTNDSSLLRFQRRKVPPAGNGSDPEGRGVCSNRVHATRRTRGHDGEGLSKAAQKRGRN